MSIKLLAATAAAVVCASPALAAEPIAFQGQAVVTAAPATGCPGVGTVATIIYRIKFGDRPDSLLITFPWSAGRELRPKGRTTFAAKGTAMFGEATGFGFWTGDVAYEGFSVTPSTGVATADTVRVKITHVQPDGDCKITLDAGLARQG